MVSASFPISLTGRFFLGSALLTSLTTVVVVEPDSGGAVPSVDCAGGGGGWGLVFALDLRGSFSITRGGALGGGTGLGRVAFSRKFSIGVS